MVGYSAGLWAAPKGSCWVDKLVAQTVGHSVVQLGMHWAEHSADSTAGPTVVQMARMRAAQMVELSVALKAVLWGDCWAEQSVQRKSVR